MKPKKLIIPFLIITILICIIAYPVYRHYALFLPLSYSSVEYTGTDAALDNPYCGWYQIYAYTLSDETPDTSAIDKSIADDPYRLALVQINLKLYRETPVSDMALSNLDSILSKWADSNKQIILRFLYDWDGNASATEPTDINVILKHMEQTADVYNKYARSIYILQGLYIGNYGEMHGSYHQSEEDLMCLANKLHGLADPLIFMSVRTPAQLRCISGNTGGVTDDRLGLFNDGMLASSSDAGTYIEKSRNEEIAFQDRLCTKVPNGGEVIIDNPYNDFDNAVKDLKAMHVSYLNSLYDPAVLNKWKASSYTGDGIFNGCDGYGYIGKHLGCRYIIKPGSLSFEPYKDKTARLSIKIQNTGFATSYYPLDYTITCIKTDKASSTGKTYTFKGEPGKQEDQENFTIIAELSVRDMETGTYDIYLNTTDSKTGESIKYAINAPLTKNGYLTGTLTCGSK